MRIWLLIVCFLNACGDDGPSIHDTITCSSTWGAGGGACESGCEVKPENQDMDPPGTTSRACIANHDDYTGPANPDLLMCMRAATVDGVDGRTHQGCCVARSGTIQFWECCRRETVDGITTYTCPE